MSSFDRKLCLQIQSYNEIKYIDDIVQCFSTILCEKKCWWM